MTLEFRFRWRAVAPSLRLPITIASAMTLSGLAALSPPAKAQQSLPQPPAPLPSPAATGQPAAPSTAQGTPLPTVPVEPPKVAAPQQQPQTVPVPAPKQAAPAPQPKAVASPAPKVAPARKVVVRKPAPKAQPAVAAVPPPSLAPSDPATALGSYNPALDTRGLVLPPGTIVTTAGPVQGYRAFTSMSATKTATPIEQTPQSIQVVPRALLDDQRTLTLDEAVRNVSNTQGINTLNIGNTDMNPLKLRGFPAEQWLDGMVHLYSSGDRDAFANVERVEVLKGPSAILYGGGPGAPVGGAVNVISKLPTDIPGVEVGGTIGSHNYYRSYFDVNQPLAANGSILFRMTGEYGGAHSFVDVLESKRYSFNPTLTFTNKVDTTLTIQGRVSRFEQQAYPGLPAVGTVAGDFKIDPKLFAGDQKIMPSYTKVAGVTVTLDHRIDSIWSFNVKARVSKSEFDQNSQGPQTAAPDAGATSWSLINTELAQKQEEFTINPNLQARFGLGATRNTLLLGADYSRVTDKGFMNVDFGVFPVDLTNPIFITPYSKPDPNSPFFFPFYNFDGVYTTKGAYAQLQSTIHDRLHLLAGVRLASIDVSYYERVPYFAAGFLPPETFTVDKTKALPRVGAVLDVLPWLSAYASYSEGMRWSTFVQEANLAPEESQQSEAGFKYKFGDQLSGTIAVFDLKRTNVPTVTGVGVTRYSAQESKGYEADLVWQPSRNLKILANYGYADAEFSDSFTGIPKGNKLSGVPVQSGRLWVNYGFDGMLKGWSIGSGIYVSSGQFVDNANLYKTGSFFTVDAKVAYETERFKAALHVKNLTDEHYFTPYPWFGGQVAPGDGRAVYGTFVMKY